MLELRDDRRMMGIMRCFDELAMAKNLPAERDLELAVAQGLVQQSEIQACLYIRPGQVGYISDEEVEAFRRDPATYGR